MSRRDPDDVRNPFEEIERMFDRMSREFAGAGREFDRPALAGGGVSVDVADRDGEVVVTADLPGYEKADIDLTVDGDRLTLAAERTRTTDEEEGDYVRRERRHAQVRRTVRLPEAVLEDEATATYTNGVLTVTLPKRSGGGDRIEIE
jgi:HSP20 family protein